MTIAKSGASVSVGVWNVCFQLVSPLFLLCGMAAVLAPPHPGGSSVQVRAVLGTWSLEPGRVLSWTHKSPLNIFSPPASQGHGSYTGGKLIPDPQFHDHGSMCYLQPLQDFRHNLEKRRDLAGRIYLHFGKLCGPHLWCLVLINVQIFYSQSFVKISHYST